MKFLFLTTLCVCSVSLYAQHRQLPQIPAKTFDIKDYGADSSGKTMTTIAIQKALDQIAKDGGGKLTLSKGTYLSGPLRIKSHTELYLESGAILRLTDDIENYPNEKNNYLNFLEIVNATDIKISGSGTIDGQGKLWWDRYDKKELKLRRPQVLYMDRPTRVEITGVRFLNPPNTHISVRNGSDIYIHHIQIEAPETSHNTDGINISARYCSITDCSISTGDDNIALNFSKLKDTAIAACEQIIIKNCSFGKGHGLSIGSYTAGNLKTLKVKDCSFNGTTSGLRIKSSRGRGGLVEDVEYENITFKNCPSPIYVSAYYPKEPKHAEEDTTMVISANTPHYKNIRFRNIRAENAEYAIRLWGLPEMPLSEISFEKVEITSKNGAVLNNVRKAAFKNAIINVKEGDKVRAYRSEISGL